MISKGDFGKVMIKENTVPYSSLKIFAHSKEIDKVKNGERTAPIYVRIKPTNKCNQNCYYCHYKNPYLMLGQYKATDAGNSKGF